MREPIQCVNPEVVLDALFTQQARVAGDVVAIAEHTWAIHGVIPVDGEVILAEYPSEAEARAVLDTLAAFERREEAERQPATGSAAAIEADRTGPRRREP